MNILEIKDFLTIRKKVYNHFLDRMTDKVIRYYNWKYLPPTIDYVIDPTWIKNIPEIEKTINLKIKEIPEQEKIKFKENIEIQNKVLEQIKKRNEKYNYRCWLIELKTWKWKSHVILDITKYYNTNTLILVHNVKTLWEMCEKFKKFTNIEPAQYWWWKKELWKITIMTKKSFTLDYKKFSEKFSLVLIDEAPVQFTKKFWTALNIFFNWQKWVALYWLSWTPYQDILDQKDLEKYFWLTIKVKWQENNWYNIIPNFTFYDYHFNWRYEYENPAEMRTAISENQTRLKEQIKNIKELFKNSKCLLILTDRKNEVFNFEEQIKKIFSEKIFMFPIHGDTKIKDDEKNIKKAKEKILNWEKIIIFWTIQKVWIWVDIPFIDTIFLASAIKFKATVIQAIWRWLRKFKDKNKVLVWVWNDLPILNNQRREKIKTITSEYWIKKEDIEINKIWKKERIKF